MYNIHRSPLPVHLVPESTPTNQSVHLLPANREVVPAMATLLSDTFSEETQKKICITCGKRFKDSEKHKRRFHVDHEFRFEIISEYNKSDLRTCYSCGESCSDLENHNQKYHRYSEERCGIICSESIILETIFSNQEEDEIKSDINNSFNEIPDDEKKAEDADDQKKERDVNTEKVGESPETKVRSKKKLVRCEECDTMLVGNWNLKRHMETVTHKEKLEEIAKMQEKDEEKAREEENDEPARKRLRAAGF